METDDPQPTPTPPPVIRQNIENKGQRKMTPRKTLNLLDL